SHRRPAARPGVPRHRAARAGPRAARVPAGGSGVERRRMTARTGTTVRSAISGAVRDARASWRRRHAAWAGAFAVAALVPVIVSSPLRLQSWASGLYIALAAVGLNFAVGLGGLPSLGQGAFVGVGAFATASL